MKTVSGYSACTIMGPNDSAQALVDKSHRDNTQIKVIRASRHRVCLSRHRDSPVLALAPTNAKMCFMVPVNSPCTTS